MYIRIIECYLLLQQRSTGPGVQVQDEGLRGAGRNYRYGGSDFIEEIKNSSILQHQPILQAIV